MSPGSDALFWRSGELTLLPGVSALWPNRGTSCAKYTPSTATGPSPARYYKCSVSHRSILSSQKEREREEEKERENTYEIPEEHAHQQCPSHNIPDESRDQGLPNVKRRRYRRVTVENCRGHKVHVGHNVIESQSDERKRGPPDRHDFAKVLPRHKS